MELWEQLHLKEVPGIKHIAKVTFMIQITLQTYATLYTAQYITELNEQEQKRDTNLYAQYHTSVYYDGRNLFELRLVHCLWINYFRETTNIVLK